MVIFHKIKNGDFFIKKFSQTKNVSLEILDLSNNKITDVLEPIFENLRFL